MDDAAPGSPGARRDLDLIVCGILPNPNHNHSAENVRYLDLIAEIARQGWLDAYLTSGGIVLVPEGEDPLSIPKSPGEEIRKSIRVAR